MNIIEITELTKVFRTQKKRPGFSGVLRAFFRPEYTENRAVDNVSFSIAEGELVGFLGPNGAGKTTTLKMLAGILYPTSGKARVLGFTPWERKTPTAGSSPSSWDRRTSSGGTCRPRNPWP